MSLGEMAQASRLDSNAEASTSGAAPPRTRSKLPSRQERQLKMQKWLDTRTQKKQSDGQERPAQPRVPSVATLKYRVLKAHNFPVTSVVFSHNGELLATASRDVRLYDARSGSLRVILDGHGGLVRSIAFTPDNRLLCSGGDDCTALVWNLEQCFALCTPGTIPTLTPPGGPSSTNLPTNDPTQFQGSPARPVSAGSSGPLMRKLSVSVLGISLGIPGSFGGGGGSSSTNYSPMSRVVQRALKRHHKPVLAVATTPDSKYLVTGSADKTVRVWDVFTGYIMATLRGHQGEVMSVAVTPNGRRIVSSGADRTIFVWDFVTGECKRALTGHNGPVSCVSVAPDGHYLVTGSHDKTIRVWDLINGNELATLPAHSGSFGVLSVAVSSDGTTIMSGGYDNLVKLWDAGTGLVTATLQGHRHMITAVAFNGDCTMLATAGRDDEARVWNWDHVRVVTDPGDGTGVAQATIGGGAASGAGGGSAPPPTPGSRLRSSQLEDALNNRHWAFLIGEQMARELEDDRHHHHHHHHHPAQGGAGVRPLTAPVSRAL